MLSALVALHKQAASSMIKRWVKTRMRAPESSFWRIWKGEEKALRKEELEARRRAANPLGAAFGNYDFARGSYGSKAVCHDRLLWVDSCPSQGAAMGRLLPLVTGRSRPEAAIQLDIAASNRNLALRPNLLGDFSIVRESPENQTRTQYTERR